MSSDRARAYTAAGVDIEAGNALVRRIRGLVASTQTRGVLADIGGFGGLFRPDLAGMAEPVLVASTDGVGTKLKLAFAWNKHDTVGIDLVAMSANDILVQGLYLPRCHPPETILHQSQYCLQKAAPPETAPGLSPPHLQS